MFHKLSIGLLIIGLFFNNQVKAQQELSDFIKSFDYDTRKEMKVSNEEIIQLLLNDEAILLDIRFEEEHLTWSMDYSLKMPLNQIPNRLNELPKNKRIITACPHKDRAIIAMLYLETLGYKTGYLSEGLLGLADHLRGDKAKDFIQRFNTKKNN